jgi:hypothetical protein
MTAVAYLVSVRRRCTARALVGAGGEPRNPHQDAITTTGSAPIAWMKRHRFLIVREGRGLVRHLSRCRVVMAATAASSCSSFKRVMSDFGTKAAHDRFNVGIGSVAGELNSAVRN